MNLEEKCQEHWFRLGIVTLEDFKDHIRGIFKKHDNQGKVLTEIYELFFPEWTTIKKIHGHPEVGNELWAFICREFMEFDRKNYPDVMAGGAWMNTGFSANRDLGPWEISFANCPVEYEGGQGVE